MPRYKFGPEIGVVNLAKVVLDPTPKTDVDVAFGGYTEEGLFHFQLPAYDLTKVNQLNAIHVGLYPEASTPPTDPAAVLTAPHHYSVPTASLQGGGTVSVDATAAPVANYLAVAVLEFAQ